LRLRNCINMWSIRYKILGFLSSFLFCIFLLPISTFAVTYATWDAGVLGTHASLSGGNLILTGDGTGWASTQSTISHTSGKWYWENKLTVNSNAMVGVTTSIGNVNIYFCFSSTGYALFQSSGGGGWNKCNSNSFSGLGSELSVNDVVGIALDMDNGTLKYNINGGSFTTVYTGLTGTMFAGGATGDNGASEWTTNFGAAPLTYTPPAGYCAGLSDTCGGGGGGGGGGTTTPSTIATSSVEQTQLNIFFSIILFFVGFCVTIAIT